jgi:hypothetical protein
MERNGPHLEPPVTPERDRSEAAAGPVLSKALARAGKALGLSQAEVGGVIGRDRTALARNAIDPDTKSGELALLLVRVYRSLHVLVGGDARQLRHWMHTPNLHLGGVPAELVRSVPGLVRVVEYLDALRGRV